MNNTGEKITIVDYGMGNIRSVQRKFLELGYQAESVDNYEAVMKAEKLVLPGVGHFANGVKNLKSRGLWDAVNEKVIDQKTPVLGICLGLQLMAKHSEEGDVEGFGWLDAEVVHFDVKDKLKFKVPHIGWNSAIASKTNAFTKDLNPENLYYFVHSYHLVCRIEAEILGVTNYEYDFHSIAGRDHIIGVQFHPEKSHEAANDLINKFALFKRV
ncbi:MAG: imidazole glycerol phosphate synthase subunit HisH [Bacteroidia bacterium]